MIGINGLQRSETQVQHDDKEKPELWFTARCALRRGFTLAEPVVAPSEFEVILAASRSTLSSTKILC